MQIVIVNVLWVVLDKRQSELRSLSIQDGKRSACRSNRPKPKRYTERESQESSGFWTRNAESITSQAVKDKNPGRTMNNIKMKKHQC